MLGRQLQPPRGFHRKRAGDFGNRHRPGTDGSPSSANLHEVASNRFSIRSTAARAGVEIIPLGRPKHLTGKPGQRDEERRRGGVLGLRSCGRDFVQRVEREPLSGRAWSIAGMSNGKTRRVLDVSLPRST